MLKLLDPVGEETYNLFIEAKIMKPLVLQKEINFIKYMEISTVFWIFKIFFLRFFFSADPKIGRHRQQDEIHHMFF